MVDEESQQTIMDVIPFGKGEGFAGKASETLAQGVEPPLDMSGLTFFFANHAVKVKVKDIGIGLPAITRGTAQVIAGNTPPQLQGSCFAAICEPVGHDLVGAATQCQPQPAFLPLTANERP